MAGGPGSSSVGALRTLVSSVLGPTLGWVLAWTVSRGLVLWLFLGRHGWVTGDVNYFSGSLGAVASHGLGDTLVEYPLPGLAVIAFPWLLVETVGAQDAYREAVLVLSMVADAAFTVLLARCAQSRRAALAVWLLAVPLLGATTYARFDLVPGLLTGTSLLLLLRRPGLAAASAAVATGLKLWPALVLPALAAPTASRRRVVTVAAVTGGTLTSLSLLLAGWDRLVSPLTWQAERGLQIESVAATPAMVARVLSPGDYEVAFTEHNAFEVGGPGTQTLLAASEVASLLLVPLLLGLWAIACRRGRDVSIGTVAWLALAAVGAFMVTSKVLSPQYLLWLLPLAAAAVGVTRAGGAEGRALRGWTALLLVVAAVTQLVFPELYGHLLGGDSLSRWAVLALVLRNTLLVALVGWAAVSAVRGVSAAGRSTASHPARVGTTPGASAGAPPTRT